MAEHPSADLRDVATPIGPGRLALTPPVHRDSLGLLVLGHGAGGRGWSADVLAVREAAVAAGWTVCLVDQPWRLAGRKVADRPPRLDEAWLPLVARARSLAPTGPLVVGGRSAGARVACRTASTVGAAAVLCLSFPLHPPGRPAASRADELRAPSSDDLPVLVLQGARDPFGTPAEVRAAASGAARVVEVPGTHSLTSPAQVGAAGLDWLAELTRR